MADKQNVVQLIIEGNNITAIKAIDGTTTKLNELNSKSGSITGAIGNAFGSMQAKVALAVSAAASAAVTGFALMVKGAVETADEIYQLSQRTGVTAEVLSTLKYAAEQSDVEIEKLATSFKFLNKNISDARDGGKESIEIFKKLGVEFNDAEGKAQNADKVLLQIADRFKYMPDGADKAAASLKLFGRSGEELIPFLNAGADGIERLQDEARKLGLEISTNTAMEADRLNDSIDRLKKSIEGVANQTLPGLLNTLADVTDGVFNMNQAAKDADNIFEMLANLETNAIIEGIRKGQQFKEDSFAEAITNAAERARQKMIGLTDDEVKHLALEVNNKISALKKLTPDDNVKNDIAQLEAQVTVYNKRFEISEKTKNEIQKLRDLENDIRFKIQLSGLTEFEQKLLMINNEIEQLRKKGVSESLLSQFSAAETGKLTQGVIDEGLAEAFKLDQEMNAAIMQGYDAEILGALEASAFKKELWIEDLELKKQLAEEEAQIEEMKNQNYANSFGMMGDSLMQFAQLSGNVNKGLFEAAKAFSIAEAVINTYVGANKALAQGGFLGAFMAASVIAMGLANVARIASTQPGSRGAGGYGGGSVRVPSYNTNNAITNNTTNNNVQQPVQITISVNGETIIGQNIPGWVRDTLTPEINKAINDGLIKTNG